MKETASSKAATTPVPETRPMTWHPKFHDQGHGCPLCGKAFKTHDKKRFIHIGEGGASIMRADLPLGGGEGDSAILSSGKADTGNMGWFEVGSGCAKKLGAAWSKELPPLIPVTKPVE
jgi:hypothetical protein